MSSNSRLQELRFKILIIGASTVGKTSILLKYLENKIRNEHNPFINSYHTSMKSNNESKNNCTIQS